MSLGYPDPRLANSTTGIYLQRTFNIEPKETRFMPGVGKPKTYTERLRMGLDCDEVYPGIIIGKVGKDTYIIIYLNMKKCSIPLNFLPFVGYCTYLSITNWDLITMLIFTREIQIYTTLEVIEIN